MTAKLQKVKAVKEKLAELCQEVGIAQFERNGYNNAYKEIYNVEVKLEDKDAKEQKPSK
jgi:hypothetical protein